MKFRFFVFISIATVALFSSCDDELDIQQEYDFSLSCWHLQSAIRKDESVEIRFTLHRTGNYVGTRYYLGYIQIEGKGEVCDGAGMLLVNREIQSLGNVDGLDARDPENQVFTLFYKSLAAKKSEVQFVVVDNFGRQCTLMVSFENDTET